MEAPQQSLERPLLHHKGSSLGRGAGLGVAVPTSSGHEGPVRPVPKEQEERQSATPFKVDRTLGLPKPRLLSRLALHG